MSRESEQKEFLNKDPLSFYRSILIKFYKDVESSDIDLHHELIVESLEQAVRFLIFITVAAVKSEMPDSRRRIEELMAGYAEGFIKLAKEYTTHTCEHLDLPDPFKELTLNEKLAQELSEVLKDISRG